MRDVFPPEKHAIAVYPLNNWGGLEITAIEEACVEVTTNNGERRKQAGRHKNLSDESGPCIFHYAWLSLLSGRIHKSMSAAAAVRSAAAQQSKGAI